MARPNLQQKLACANCAGEMRRKPSQIYHGNKTGPLAGLMFCSRSCQTKNFRSPIRCSWFDCEKTRLIEARYFRFKEARGWLCEHHTDRMEALTGSRKMTARKLEFIQGKPLDHNRVSWLFVKFVVYERAGGRCCGCSTPVRFAARPVPFHSDHIRPVWQGGKTVEPNLQLLCLTCHKIKSSAEQKLVNQTRWNNRRLGAHFQRMTHTEKDALISRLLARISELESSAAHPLGEQSDGRQARDP